MAKRHAHPSQSFAGSSVGEYGRTDPLSDVLRVVKLTGALFFISQASTPWGTEVPPAEAFAPIILPRARHVVSYHIILKGSGWGRHSWRRFYVLQGG
jgi:hypothetical protein